MTLHHTHSLTADDNHTHPALSQCLIRLCMSQLNAIQRKVWFFENFIVFIWSRRQKMQVLMSLKEWHRTTPVTSGLESIRHERFSTVTSNGLCEMEKAGLNIVFIAKTQTLCRGKSKLLGVSGRSQNKLPSRHRLGWKSINAMFHSQCSHVGYLCVVNISLLFSFGFIVSR